MYQPEPTFTLRLVKPWRANEVGRLLTEVSGGVADMLVKRGIAAIEETAQSPKGKRKR